MVLIFDNHLDFMICHSKVGFFFSLACSIKLEERFILIGGSDSHSTFYKHAHVYDETGLTEMLPDLQVGRNSHGCGYFYNNDNQLVSYIVYPFIQFILNKTSE